MARFDDAPCSSAGTLLTRIYRYLAAARTFTRLLPLSLLVAVSGCDKVLCHDPCPGAGEVRDSFCGCMKLQHGNTGPLPSNPSKPYMIARYSCKDNSHPDMDAGSCDLMQSAESCQAAKNAILQEVQSRGGDACVHCTAGTTDNTKHWDGNPPSWIQGGPCTNESLLQPTSSNPGTSAVAERSIGLPERPNPRHTKCKTRPRHRFGSGKHSCRNSNSHQLRNSEPRRSVMFGSLSTIRNTEWQLLR